MLDWLRRLLRVEPKVIYEDRYLMGAPTKVTLFEAFHADCCHGSHYGYFSTAQRAHEAYPDKAVRPVCFYRIGDDYIERIDVRLLDLKVDEEWIRKQPKQLVDTTVTTTG